MNLKKIYQSTSIPTKKNPFLEDGEELVIESFPKGSDPKGIGNDSFIEIKITETTADSGSQSIPKTQAIKPMGEQNRSMFYSMKQIARDMSYNVDHSKLFYQQAQFMKDYTDDYEENAPFFAYYPCYQNMGHEQLRTYFSWRTQVRKGIVTGVSTSYAFLYIYELLNNIGVGSPQDGLDQLMAFWQGFRAFDTVVDRYVLQWIKDYHIYYTLKKSFKEFVNEHHLQIHYPTIFGYEDSGDSNFGIYADISKYAIRKSIFYNEQNMPLIHGCFDFILNRFRERFEEKQMRFEDLVFCTLERDSIWIPFGRALFYPIIEQPDHEVILSDREIYHCRDNRWVYKSAILSEAGRQMIGYIMKEMEASLRKATKFKHKLNASPSMCDRKILETFVAMGISIPGFIQESVLEYKAIQNRKVVSVNVEKLKQIRHEALQTQEKLIVPEKEVIEEQTVAQVVGARESVELEAVQLDTALHEGIESDAVEQTISAPEVNGTGVVPRDIWTELKESLTLVELEALKIILHGEDIKGYALQKRVMLEVLMDGINDKAMDCLGDTILELDDEVIVYEDYQTKLMEMVRE